MKIKTIKLSIPNSGKLLNVFREGFPERYSDSEVPLRSELLSTDQMEQRGKLLAGEHILDTGKDLHRHLLNRLAENEEVLIETRKLVAEAVKARRQITPAGEWLLDNFYVIDDNIQIGKRHLPKGYSKELPRLLNGPSKGFPRVYDMALNIISHGDGKIDPEILSRFVISYQSVTPLKLGELWAIPIMLRLALIENLRRVAIRLSKGRVDRDLANSWADRMLETAEKKSKDLIIVIADMARSDPPQSAAFVSELARRLQGQSPSLALPLTWIEQHLSETGLTIERQIQLGNQQLAADQLSISNSINSLRFLSAMDWKEFVETMSVVDQKLRYDPAGAYNRMDFATRDHYRHVVEQIAKRSPLSEEDVASRAIEFARQNAQLRNNSHRTAHVGYYLIDKGLPRLERSVNMHMTASRMMRNIGKRANLFFYSVSILLITFLMTAGLMIRINDYGINTGIFWLTGLLLFIGVSHFSVAVVNWLSTLLAKPGPLPRMDLSQGIPPEARTMVVIPTLLISPENIDDLTEALEVRFLANRDENLHFALLTDFRDADKEIMPGDENLVKLACQKIEGLNEKYPEPEGDTFFLFHRPRKWNEQERLWMGYERKRGKLSELNSLFRNGPKDKFSVIIGNTDILSNIRYVITLDSDTQLPRDSARQFIGNMEHPLNRPQVIENKKIVYEGYGILQPRMGASLGSNLSFYANVFGSEPGIDPYTKSVSDVYQDLFAEGSFIGKGIYDVDVFEKVFRERFPENRILSHDLIEGCYARSGLISDVQLYELYPSLYMADVNRRHRWIRGDWQIARWLFPNVPHLNGKQKNPLTFLSRWKIFDNLRRSLITPALTAILIIAWFILSQPFFWTLIVAGIIFIPPLMISLFAFGNKSPEIILIKHLADSVQSAGKHLVQAAFNLLVLPFEAFYSLDAIFRTLWRLLISRRRLLEWNHSASEDQKLPGSAIETFRVMWIAPFAFLIIVTLLIIMRPDVLDGTLPVLTAWLVSPYIVWLFSRKPSPAKTNLSDEQIIFLRQVARRTWAFFDKFVGPDDNWLPPDNFQENPAPVIAHRTSPTNMGLSLLANLSAYDFGFITIGKLLERTFNALHTMGSMERHKGHFYNWYDTQSLMPLRPLYISSVDSGNLAGHLLVLQSGLIDIPGHKIVNPGQFKAMFDTLKILEQSLPSGNKEITEKFSLGLKTIDYLSASLSDTIKSIENLVKLADEIALRFAGGSGDQIFWSEALSAQCSILLDELKFLTPWMFIPEFRDNLEKYRSLDQIPALNDLIRMNPDTYTANGISENEFSEKAWTDELKQAIFEGSNRAVQRIESINHLSELAREFSIIDYEFLYDKTRHLQAIGYNVDERLRDSSYYDLLASEARFCSFVAIAQGQVSQESWFSMGRLLAATGGDPVLLSWSGSMFEYLMPLLVMPGYENTLLYQTYRSAVKRHIEYGKQRGIPWGISESGYNMVDINMNYQYRAFGVPGLGLKRGLADDLVIAPYASVLALMVLPEEACLNLEKLASLKFLSKYGFYEAIDYTPARIPRGRTFGLVQSHMAHHQGMSLIALSNLLLDRPMHKRFESNPLFRSTLLLLQEKIPRLSASYRDMEGSADIHLITITPEMPMRVISTPDTPIPEVHLLSNSRYHVMVTNSGGGYSLWNDIAITRWREDSTRDNWGMFFYIRDLESGVFWSSAYQPSLRKPELYEAIFSKGRAEYRRRDNDLDTYTEIVISPEDDIELRRIRITNRSRNKRSIDLTSYAEVVLASPVADSLHPAFSNLFIQTEILDQQRAILCTRRPRSDDETSPWMFHLMTAYEARVDETSYETDRQKFIGRGNTLSNPDALINQGMLSGSQGSVLDPIVSIRMRIILAPEEVIRIDVVSGIVGTRESALALIHKYQDRRLTDRIFELAWTYSQVVLRQINASEADAQLYGHLASSIIYSNSSLRANPNILIKNRRGQSGLWSYAISGDLPIVLVQVEDQNNINLVKQLIQAHAYWRLKGLKVDLVIWNEDRTGYRQNLNDAIIGLIASSAEAGITDRPGGIFVRVADQISNEDRILLQTVARVIISDKKGPLSKQIYRKRFSGAPVAELKTAVNFHPGLPIEPASPREDLAFFNGFGGFTSDGHEYIITTAKGQITPLPWVNVLANSHFGSVIAENGLSYTWYENAHEYRLTPWSNDPVSDPGGEVFYIRDEENGKFWSPSPQPAAGTAPYVTRHGFGYSVFEHTEDGIRSELWVYVALDAPVKFYTLKLQNLSGRPRRLSVTGYAEWVLGDLRSRSAMHLTTEVNSRTGALFAHNPYNTEIQGRVAFFHTDDSATTFTCDRTEFIGRNRALTNPASMSQSHLSGRSGAGFDPCAAIQVAFDLSSGQGREIIFRLGVGKNNEDAESLINRFWGSGSAQKALEDVWNFWNYTLGSVQVESPDRSLNILTNGWLLYQTIACRIWGRSGFYQSGGAYGFRDQLQDAGAIIHSVPHITREHLLLCASRQFREGDVQHWWHPPSGRGVRTHCSDDYLWLPLITCRYVLGTGDTGVLDEQIAFLEGRFVKPEEDSYYDLPNRSEEVASLYQHCVRAVLKGLSFGKHGLPLIGTGDWNDGMNLVGHLGKGESVWLGFFLYNVLMEFSKIAQLYNDQVMADRCRREATVLKTHIEKNCWDGEWYLRAWFDDGSPLGSSQNEECRIDSISQSWSVLSEAGATDRCRTAMASVDKYLVKRENSIIQLLDPPFDKSDLNPGYIKGYVPGVRENGGQYTHAAIWTTMAFAELGDTERAWELFSMINPINHGSSPESAAKYKAEPYVVAADVYSLAPHTGRGGWTWYTGSAGWMYRLITESLLGLRLQSNKLYIEPCIPKEWDFYKIHYRYRETLYHITIKQVTNNNIINKIIADGITIQDNFITLIDDRKEHFAEVFVTNTEDSKPAENI